MNKLFLFLFCSLIFVQFCVPVHSAGIIGVSPATVEFRDVLRGGYSERSIVVTYDQNSPVRAVIESQGNISTWFNLSKKDFLVSRTIPGQFLLSVLPPSDTPNGNYTGIVRIKAEQLDSSTREGHATGIVVAMLEVVVSVEVVDTEIVSCTAHEFHIDSVEQKDPLVFHAEVINNGNIRISPQVSLRVWDESQETIVNEIQFYGIPILPSQTATITHTFPSGTLPTGQYWVDASVVDCAATDLLTFDILAPGTLKADGVLTNMFSVSPAHVGDTVPVIVVFKNIGEKDVTAYFKGEIDLNGKIFQVLESEKILVPVKTSSNFTLFFTPPESGTYISRGRVFYDTKRTFESSTKTDVLAAFASIPRFVVYLLYGLMALVIIFLLYKIRKERRKLWRSH